MSGMLISETLHAASEFRLDCALALQSLLTFENLGEYERDES